MSKKLKEIFASFALAAAALGATAPAIAQDQAEQPAVNAGDSAQRFKDIPPNPNQTVPSDPAFDRRMGISILGISASTSPTTSQGTVATDDKKLSTSFKDARNPNATYYDAAAARPAAGITIGPISVQVPSSKGGPK